MRLGDTTLIKETLDIEYKEFRIYYSPGDDFRSIFDNIDFHLEESFSIMVNKYVLKNISSFINSDIDGCLRLGITDNGTAIGIPAKNPDILIDKIKNSIFGLNHGITIEAIPVDIDNFSNFFYSSTEQYIDKLHKINKDYEEYIKDFENRKKYFIYLLSKYRISLSYLFNDSEVYEGFKIYLKYHGVYEKFESQLPPNINLNDIVKNKKNKDSIIHWMVEFRDECTDYIVYKFKPLKDPTFRRVNVYYEIIMSFLPMIPYLLNNGYNLYIVDIKVNASKYDQKIYYKDAIYNRYMHPISGPFVSHDITKN